MSFFSCDNAVSLNKIFARLLKIWAMWNCLVNS